MRSEEQWFSCAIMIADISIARNGRSTTTDKRADRLSALYCAGFAARETLAKSAFALPTLSRFETEPESIGEFTDPLVPMRSGQVAILGEERL